MSAFLADWLIDTFVWTGALVAMVLLLRRPVARAFGPGVSYALWGLVMLRFVLPPLVLPASMAPVREAQTVFVPAVEFVDTAPAAPSALSWVEPLLLALWLGGAVFFLAMRVRSYRRMRAHLLAEARPVGEAGKVRLVETPAASAPVAFGLFDKVVALPPGFMAHYDRDARDLAIAHELAHHRGHDLLANMAAQGVLALHWFNPLAWLGWRAMRSDQEAACDARVMAGRTRGERAAYAQVIAGFARGQDFALAAPMACPMLGDKSIVHRLKSLTRDDCARGRRIAGVSALALCAVALPLTASVSYASPPAPPSAPPAPAAPEAPDAPLPPEAPIAQVPAAPDAPPPPDVVFLPEDLERVNAEVAAAMVEAREAQAEARVAEAEAREAEVQARAEVAAAMAEMPVVEEHCDGDEVVREWQADDGRRIVQICHEAAAREASRGLEQARAEVARQRDLPAKLRQEILRNLDRQIEQARNPGRASAVSTADGARAVATASAGSATPVAFVKMPGSVTATLRFVASFSGPDAPQAISVTVPVSVTLTSTAATPPPVGETV